MGLRLVALLFSLVLPLSSKAAETSRLFLIHSYAPNFWTNEMREGLLNDPVIKSLPLQEYYFDSDYWHKKGALAEHQDEKLKALIRTMLPSDLLVIGDDEVASILRSRISPKQKTILLGINGSSQVKNWDSFCEKTESHAIVFEDFPYKKALAFARQKFPEIKKFNAIGGDTETSKKMIDGLRSALADTQFELTESLLSREWSIWREKLRGWSDKKSLTWYFVPFGLRDSMNEEISPKLVAGWIKENAPSIGLGAGALESGLDVVVGISARDLGAEGARFARLLLSSKPVECRNPSESYRIRSGGRKR